MANASRDQNRIPTLLLENTSGTGQVVPTGVVLTNSTAQHVAVVDGSGNQITSFGGGTQYAEGATTSPGTGTLSLGRYKATPPSLTDGQMSGLQLDSSGNLKITGSITVGGTTDNSAFTAGTSTGTPAMGFYHSAIDTVTDGRAATIGITSKRAMFVNLQNASGTEIGTASNPIQVSLANTGANSTAVKVDGSAVTQPISASSLPLPTGAATAANQSTGNTSLGNIDTNTTNIPNVIGTAASAIPSKLLQIGGSDGTNARAIKVNTSGQLDIRPLTSSDQITIANSSIAVTGTFWQSTQPVSLAASSIASGAAVSGSFADGSLVTLGAKADARSTATDTTAITIMQVLKEISFMEQNPASRAVTNAGTFAVQATQSGTWTVTASSDLSTIPVVGQIVIAVTNTRIQLGSNTLKNGIIITAKSSNAAAITVGGSTVTNTVDGTGNGYILEAGSSVSFAVTNSNDIYVNGTAGDIISFAGS